MVQENQAFSEDEVDRQANAEVIDEASDLISGLEVRLQQVRAGVLDRTTAAEMLTRDAHNLKMMARSASIDGLTSITHRLDDYLADVKSIDDQHISDLQAYGDRIAKLLEGDTVDIQDVPTVVRSLPGKKSFELSDIVITDTEVTLVMPQRAAARAIERELAACGYRVTICLSVVDAIELIIETKPDLVITSMVMPKLSGVDLSCALAAMPATKGIPVALLTSLEKDHADLKQLPINTGFIRRGPEFGDDLAIVLERFDIT